MSSTVLNVHTQGQLGNPVLLFLHAFPFSSEMWSDQMAHLFEKFYCVAPNLSGFGESALPNHAVTFEHHVDAVLEFLKEAKIEKAVWCGLSMGGYLALRLFERAPEKCRALILCDTKSGADGNEAKLKRAGAIALVEKSRSEFVEAQWKALVGESSQSNVLLKAHFEELVSKVSDKGVAAGLVALATRTDTTEGLKKINVPTLILVGEEDKVTPPAESEAMAKAISGSKLTVIASSGHLSNLENAQSFNHEISQFLATLS